MQLDYDRLMVTGGMGFIGSHTVDALLQNNAEVWVLDDLSSGYLRNLERWKQNPKLHFQRGSVISHRTVAALTRKVEAIVHLAAVVSPVVSVRRPERTNEVNVSGTLNILRAGLKNGVKRIVFASSSSLYGNPRTIPIREDTPLNPITPYGVSKLAAEHYCRVYHKTYGLSTVSLRYFNVYGERQSSNPYSGVISIFANQIAKGHQITIYGDGNQTRDFVHITDVVRANLLALKAKRGIGEAFNIGTGRATTINQLQRVLVRAMGEQHVLPTFLEARKGDIKDSCANITKARRILGFQPRITLREGLERLTASLCSAQKT
jgi:UDP-glucose 4-epimerase